MRRVLFRLVAVAIVAAGCSGSEPLAVTTTPAPPPTTPPTATATPTATPTDTGPTAPLTGLAVSEESVLERPVAAVKIDNDRPARPQQGLEFADIVFEELVEGGTTRFIAVYHSEDDPGNVGPVRSGRDVDAVLLPPFQPVFGISGAAAPVYPVLRRALLVYEEGQAGGAFFRESSRSRPYNLFATPALLWEAAPELPPASEPWPFDPSVPPGGEEVEGATLRFSPTQAVDWEWDAEQWTWLRSQGGAAHESAAGEQLDADNIVILFVPTSNSGRVDVAGNPTPEIDVIGEGRMVVLRDGEAFEGTWRKDTAEEQFQWLDAAGDPLPLNPGRTWIELLPLGAAFDLDRPTVRGTTPTPTETGS